MRRQDPYSRNTLLNLIDQSNRIHRWMLVTSSHPEVLHLTGVRIDSHQSMPSLLFVQRNLV